MTLNMTDRQQVPDDALRHAYPANHEHRAGGRRNGVSRQHTGPVRGLQLGAVQRAPSAQWVASLVTVHLVIAFSIILLQSLDYLISRISSHVQ